jgi:hypothetical protein
MLSKYNSKRFRYRRGVAEWLGRGRAVLLHNRSLELDEWSAAPRAPHFISGNKPVPILQEAGWAVGPVWTGAISRPRRDPIPIVQRAASRSTDLATRSTII